MKKYIKFLVIPLLLFLFLFPIGMVDANELSCFTVINSSNPNYSINLKLANTKFPKQNVIYVGQKLSELMNIVDLNTGTKISRTLIKWDNPEYVVVEGEQTVTATTIWYNDTITFTIKIITLMPDL